MLASFDDFYYFYLVVKYSGFSAAERATDIPKSKLSRRVQQLEKHLGVRLLQRNARKFAVTAMGQKIYQQAQIMHDAVSSAQDTIQELSITPRGTVRISVPTSIAQQEFAEILPPFLKSYPEIHIQLTVTNRRVDLINEGIDIAIRVRSQLDEDTGLVIRRLSQHQQHLYASRGYLNQYGTPKTPDELIAHRMLSMQEYTTQEEITLHQNNGQTQKVKFTPHLQGSDLLLLRQLAIQHCGIVLLPDMICHDAVQKQQLVQVLADWHAPHGTLHLIYPSRQGLLPAVRLFIDYLVEHLSTR